MQVYRELVSGQETASSVSSIWNSTATSVIRIGSQHNIPVPTLSVSLTMLNQLLGAVELDDRNDLYECGLACVYIASSFNDVLSLNAVVRMSEGRMDIEQLSSTINYVMHMTNAHDYLATPNFYLTCLKEEGILGNTPYITANMICLVCLLQQESFNRDFADIAKYAAQVSNEYHLTGTVTDRSDTTLFIRDCVRSLSSDVRNSVVVKRIRKMFSFEAARHHYKIKQAESVKQKYEVVEAEEVDVAYTLGQGGFGTVDLVVIGDKPYARKTQDTSAEFVVEVSVLARLKHHNIIGMHSFAYGEVESLIYMEPAQTTLNEEIYANFDGDYKAHWRKVFIDDVPPNEDILMSSDKVNKYFYDICSGLEHLHSLGIIHRDLKPGNILISDGTAKIADFGLCCLYTTTVKDSTPKQTACFTRAYRPPELQVCVRDDIRVLPYSYEVDIWSLGVVLLEMVTCALLPIKLDAEYDPEFDEGVAYGDRTLNTIFRLLGDPPRVYPYVDFPGFEQTKLKCVDELSKRNLILAMLSLDPRRRPKLSDIIDTL